MQIVSAEFPNSYSSKKYSFFAPDSAMRGEHWLADTSNGIQIVQIVSADIRNPAIFPYKWLFQKVHEDWMLESREVGLHIRTLRAEALQIEKDTQSTAIAEILKKNRRYQAIKKELANYGL